MFLAKADDNESKESGRTEASGGESKCHGPLVFVHRIRDAFTPGAVWEADFHASRQRRAKNMQRDARHHGQQCHDAARSK